MAEAQKRQSRVAGFNHATRRQFLGGLGATGAGCLMAGWMLGAAAQETAVASEGVLRVGGVPVRLYVAAVSRRVTRVSFVDARSRLEPVEAFRGKGLLDKDWSAQRKVFTAVGQQPEVFRLDEMSVTVSNGPLRVRVEHGAVAQEIAIDAAKGELRFVLGEAPVFGLGEGGHQFDRRGVLDTMVNGQNKPALFTTGGRNPIPWVISPAGWALYFHHPLGALDLRGSDGVFRPTEPPQPQDFFVALANEPAELLEDFAALTGMPHLPPLWTLGYHQSHRTLVSREDVLTEARTFREKRLPCDSMIYLGTGYAPSGWNTGHGSFAFNEKIFPDPEAMFRETHGEGFHVTLHVLNPPQDLHGTLADGPSSDPDAVVNYWPQHVPVMRTGVDGWWVDDGDELPAQGRLDRNRLYWDGPRELRPEVRPFAFHRNSYAGSAMWGWLWSGDTQATWETLRAQVAVGLNASVSGLPWWGSDTGGFFSTKELTAELYVRWFQFSAFCTLFRSHGRTWKLRLPWGWNMGEYGPMEDAPAMLPALAELHHPEVEGICRKFLELRYRLLPYTYSAAWECHSTGVPVMRPLWLHAPTDKKAWTVSDAYWWGRELIVAPVVEKGATGRSVYLPAGEWWEFWTEERLAGGREVERPVELADMPMFVRAGAVIPMGPVRQFVGERVEGPLELRVYPGADGGFVLYEDDGVSFAYERGVRSRVRIRWDDAARQVSFALAEGDRMQTFTTRWFRVKLAGRKDARDIRFDGSEVSVQL